MSLLIISHSYISEENQKNIIALNQHINVRVAVPGHFKSTIFRRIQAGTGGEMQHLIRVFKAIHLPRSQYILLPLMLDLRQEPTDVINVEYDPWSVMFWQALFAKKRAKPKCKIVCTVKNNTYMAYPGVLGRLKHWIAGRGIAKVDHFLACSRKVAAIYHDRFGVPWEKMTLCYHLGVDSDLFCPGSHLPNDHTRPLIVGYCGRFDADKGVLELIEAVSVCRKRLKSDLRLYLLGRGSLAGQIGQLRTREKWITCFDPVPHNKVPDFLQKLDVFVLPAGVTPEHEEHDAHALTEALSVGLPCIGTQSGITPELIGDGTGIVVSANSSERLAEAIEKLAGDSCLRTSLGAKARTKALAAWSIEALTQKKSEFFKSLGCR